MEETGQQSWHEPILELEAELETAIIAVVDWVRLACDKLQLEPIVVQSLKTEDRMAPADISVCETIKIDSILPTCSLSREDWNPLLGGTAWIRFHAEFYEGPQIVVEKPWPFYYRLGYRPIEMLASPGRHGVVKVKWRCRHVALKEYTKSLYKLMCIYFRCADEAVETRGSMAEVQPAGIGIEMQQAEAANDPQSVIAILNDTKATRLLPQTEEGQVELIQELNAKGFTQGDIAEELHISRQKVNKIMQKHRIKPAYRPGYSPKRPPPGQEP